MPLTTESLVSTKLQPSQARPQLVADLLVLLGPAAYVDTLRYTEYPSEVILLISAQTSKPRIPAALCNRG